MAIVIDAHNHLGVRPGASQSSRELISKMDVSGCQKAVIFPFVEGRFSNDPIHAAALENPDRLIPFCSVNPWDGRAALDELRRCVKDLGFKGLKLHPTLHGYHLSDPALVNPVFEAVADLRIPVITHGASDLFNAPPEFAIMARRFPKVPLIMAHMGMFWSVDQAIELAGEIDNLFLEVSRAPVFEIALAIHKLGAGKVIWGTDSPFVDYSFEMAKMENVARTREGYGLVMGGTLARILGVS